MTITNKSISKLAESLPAKIEELAKLHPQFFARLDIDIEDHNGRPFVIFSANYDHKFAAAIEVRITHLGSLKIPEWSSLVLEPRVAEFSDCVMAARLFSELNIRW